MVTGDKYTKIFLEKAHFSETKFPHSAEKESVNPTQKFWTSENPKVYTTTLPNVTPNLKISPQIIPYFKNFSLIARSSFTPKTGPTSYFHMLQSFFNLSFYIAELGQH